MNRKGFTLVELLIVISIIGLLATLAIVSLTSAQQRSRDTQRVADVKALQTALELEWNTNADYPEVVDGETTWETLQSELSDHITALPLDPNHNSGATYVYIVNPANLDEYYLAATLEDAGHASLENDIDGSVGAGWMMLDSQGNTATVGAGGFNCIDSVYCVKGDSTQ